MASIVIAGAGAVGASIAYYLSKKGARDVALVDRGAVAGGATGKATGGYRQQFTSAPEVGLSLAALPLLEELGPPYFQQYGYLYIATTEAGAAALRERHEKQQSLGAAGELCDRARVAALAPGLNTADVHAGLFGPKDGLADPPAVTRELVRRAAAAGVRVLEQTDVRTVRGDMLILATGAYSAVIAAERGVELPIRPLRRQLFETGAIARLPERLPMLIESESGFHFRRRGDVLRVAMAESPPRWGDDEIADASVVPDRLRRLLYRFPPAAGAACDRLWAGLYDMTPDAHPLIGAAAPGLWVACGFSGHGFMHAPAVGRAIAEMILDGGTAIDVSPYRPGRFAGQKDHQYPAVL